MTNLPPTEIPPQEPELPHGQTNSMPIGWFRTPEAEAAYVASNRPQPPSVVNGITLSAENVALLSTLSAAQQESVLAFWPHQHNQPSKYLNGNIVYTVNHMLMHIDGYSKDHDKEQREKEKQDAAQRRSTRQQRVEEDEAYAARHLAWQNDCSLRKAWIEGKQQEWRKRVRERDTVLAQWEAYVEQARTEYQEAKATSPPPRPQR